MRLDHVVLQLLSLVEQLLQRRLRLLPQRADVTLLLRQLIDENPGRRHHKEMRECDRQSG